MLNFAKRITIDNVVLFMSNLYKAGILCINDLINDEYKFMSFEEFCNKYNVRINYLYYISLIDAIPMPWRKVLKSSHTKLQYKIKPLSMVVIDGTNYQINKLKSKHTYWHFVNKSAETPSCINNWKKYHVEFDEQTWMEIFILPIKTSRLTKLREFQFKIIHKTYASRFILSKFLDHVDENCVVCHVKNNLVHIFVSCSKVKVWWNTFIKWYKSLTNINFELHQNDIIFGILKPGLQNYCLNFCLLQAKWYLHTCIMGGKSYDLMDFLLHLKQTLLTEFLICQEIKKEQFFEKTFKNIFENI